MRRYYFVLYLGFSVLIGCKKLIQLDLENAPKKLVIDAGIKIQKKDAETTFTAIVKLNETVPYYSNSDTKISGATVSITGKPSGKEYSLKETTDHPGEYRYEEEKNSNLEKTYELHVSHKGQTYVGEAEVSVLSNIKGTRLVEEESLFSKNKIYSFKIKIQDDPNARNYYLIELISAKINGYRISDDAFYNGELYELSFPLRSTNSGDKDDGNRLIKGDRYMIRLSGIPYGYFNYLKISDNTSYRGGDSGGFGAPPPATPRGNIINVTDKNNYPLGYFYLLWYVQYEGTI